MLKSRKIKILSSDESQIVDRRVSKGKKAKVPQRINDVESNQPAIKKVKKRPNRMRVFANKFGVAEIEIKSKNAFKVLPRISENCSV